MANSKVTSRMIAMVVRRLASTWRIRLNDLAGLTGTDLVPPVISVLWHNRLLVVPILYERLLKHRKGTALISRSRDGGLLARCIAHFGGESVRGSSSRGGASALGELNRKLEDGFDAYITPDGPRGPRYSLAPGVLWLAQSSKALIMPLGVEYSSFWRLGRWDGFVIPKPFSTVKITLGHLYQVQDTDTSTEFESERARLHGMLMAGTGML